MAKRYNIPQYSKNLRRSARHIGGNIFKQRMPVLSSTVTSAQDAYRELRRTMTSSKGRLNQERKFQMNTIFKPVKEIIANAKEDIRSGNLYNEDREFQYASRGMSDVMDTYLDDDPMATNTSAFDKVIESSSAASLSNSRMQANAISKNATANTEYLGELSSMQHSQNLLMQTKNHMETMKAFGNLEAIGMSLVEFNTKVLTDHIVKTQKYQEDSLSIMSDIKKSIDEQLNYTKKLKGFRKNGNASYNPLNDILGGAGGINISEYLNMVKGNIKNRIPVTKDMLKMVGSGYAASPISSALEFLLSAMTPKSTKKHLKELDNSIAAVFTKYLLTMDKWKQGGKDVKGWQRMLGEILGTNTVNARPNLASYRNQELTADIELKKAKAITEVIPTYLREITNALTGKDKTFDYNRGTFVDTGKRKKEIENDIRRRVTDSLGETNTLMRKNIDATRKTLSKKDRGLALDDYNTFMYFLTLNPNFDLNHGSYSDALKAGLPKLNGGEQSYKMIQSAYQSLSKNQKAGLIRDIGKSNKIYSADIAQRLNNDLNSNGLFALFNGMSGSFDGVFLNPKKSVSKSDFKSNINFGNLKSTGDFYKQMRNADGSSILETDEERKKREEKEAKDWLKTSAGKRFKQLLSKAEKSGSASMLNNVKNMAKQRLGENSFIDKMLIKATNIIDDVTLGKKSVKGVATDAKNYFSSKGQKRRKGKSSENTMPVAMSAFNPNITEEFGDVGSEEDSEGSPQGNKQKEFFDKTFEVFKKYLPKAALGGTVGGVIAKMFKKRPLVGAIAGGALNILIGTSKVQSILFGDPKKKNDKGLFGELRDNITEKVLDPFKQIFDQKIGNPFADWLGKKTDDLKVWLSDKFGFKFREDQQKTYQDTVISKLDQLVTVTKGKTEATEEEAQNVSDVLEDALNPESAPKRGKKKSKFKGIYDNAVDNLQKAGSKGMSAGKGALISSFLGFGPIPGALIGLLFEGKKKKKNAKEDEKKGKQIQDSVDESKKAESSGEYKKKSVFKGAMISNILGLGPVPGALVTMMMNRFNEKRWTKKNTKEDEKKGKQIQDSVDESKKAESSGESSGGYKKKSVFKGAMISSLLGMGPIPGALVTMMINKFNKKRWTKKNAKGEASDANYSTNASGQTSDEAEQKAEQKEAAENRRAKVKKLKLAKNEQAFLKQMWTNVKKGDYDANKELVRSNINSADTEEELNTLERSTTTISNMFNGNSGAVATVAATEKRQGLLSKLWDMISGGGGGGGLLSNLLTAFRRMLPMLIPLILGKGITKLVSWLKEIGLANGHDTTDKQGNANFSDWSDSLGSIGQNLRNLGQSVAVRRATGIKGAGMSALGATQSFDTANYYAAEQRAFEDRGDTTSAQEQSGLKWQNRTKGTWFGLKTIGKVGSKITAKLGAKAAAKNAVNMASLAAKTGKSSGLLVKLTKWADKFFNSPKVIKFFKNIDGSGMIKKLLSALKSKFPTIVSKITARAPKFLTKIASKLATWWLIIATSFAAFIRGANNAARDLEMSPDSKMFFRLRLLNGVIYALDDVLCGVLDIIGLRTWLFEALSKAALNEEQEAEIKASQSEQQANYEQFLKDNDLSSEGFTFEMYNNATNKSIWGNVKSWFTGDPLNKYKKGGKENQKLREQYGGYNNYTSVSPELANNPAYKQLTDYQNGVNGIVNNDYSTHTNVVIGDAGSGARGYAISKVAFNPSTVLKSVITQLRNVNTKDMKVFRPHDKVDLGTSDPLLYDSNFSARAIRRKATGGSGGRGPINESGFDPRTDKVVRSGSGSRISGGRGSYARSFGRGASITTDLVPSTKYTPGRTDSIKYIVIHYTEAVNGKAAGSVEHFKTSNVKSSAHYVVDANNIIQCVSDNDTAWHCGKSNTDCNNGNSIGIEMASHKNGEHPGKYWFDQGTIDNAAALTSSLMSKYGVPINNVIRHYDVNGKICPAPFISGASEGYPGSDDAWAAFKNAVASGSSSVDLSGVSSNNNTVDSGVTSSGTSLSSVKRKIINSSNAQEILRTVRREVQIGAYSSGLKGNTEQNQESEVYADSQDLENRNPTLFQRIGTSIANAASNVKDKAKSIGSKVWGGVKKVGSKIAEGAKWVGGKIASAWNAAKEWIGNTTIAKKIKSWWSKDSGSGARGGDSDYYAQFDPRWGNMSFGKYDGHRDTVAAGGCGPTVAAMALQKLTGQTITPATMARLAMNTGMKYDDGGTDPEFFNAAGSKYGVNFTNSYGLDKNTLQSLKSGKPVIFMGKDRTGTSPFGTGTHYVLGQGLDANGNINILDPQNPKNNRKFNISDIASNATNIITPNGRGNSKCRGRRCGRGGELTAKQQAVVNEAMKRIGDTSFRQGDYKSGKLKQGKTTYCLAWVKCVYNAALGLSGNSGFDAPRDMPVNTDLTAVPVGATIVMRPKSGVGNGVSGHAAVYVGNGEMVHLWTNATICKTTVAYGLNKYNGGGWYDGYLKPADYEGGAIDNISEGITTPINTTDDSSGSNSSGTSDGSSTTTTTTSGGNKLTSLLSAISGSSAGIYSSLVSALGAILGGETTTTTSGTSGGSVSSVSGVTSAALGSQLTPESAMTHDPRQFSTITTEQLKQAIRSYTNRETKMEQYADAIMAAANATGIDPRWIAAHAAGEAGWDLDSDIAKDKNNFFGINANDGNAYGNSDSFATPEEGFTAGAKWIKENYFDKGQAGWYAMNTPTSVGAEDWHSYTPAEKGATSSTRSTIYSALVNASGGAGGRGNISPANLVNLARGKSHMAISIPNRFKSDINAASINSSSSLSLVKNALNQKQSMTPYVTRGRGPVPVNSSNDTPRGSVDVDSIIAALSSIIALLGNIDKTNSEIANKNPSSNTAVISSGGGSSSFTPQTNQKQAILNSIISGI